MVRDDDVIVYRNSGRQMELHAYFDTLNLLTDEDTISTAHPIRTISLPPHSSKTIAFHESCCFSKNRGWYAIHPWNTPSIRTLNRFAAISASDYFDRERRGVARMVTAHWLDLDQIVDFLKGRVADISALKRHYHRVVDEIGFSPSGHETTVTGTCGRHMVTTLRSNAESPFRLDLLSLPSAGALDEDVARDMTGDVRTLALPMSVSNVMLLDFCDEAVTLAVCVESVDAAASLDQTHDQTIELFDY